MKSAGRILLILIGTVLVLGMSLRLRYGGGDLFPELTVAEGVDNETLETVAELALPPAKTIVSSTGRMFFVAHPAVGTEGAKLFEIVDGRAVAYPDEVFQAQLLAPSALALDGDGRLWVLDGGAMGVDPHRIYAFNLSVNEIVHEHAFPPEVAQIGSYYADMQVTRDGNFVFIADASVVRKNSALVIYDVRKRRSKRILDDHSSISGQDWVIRVGDQKMVYYAGLVALKAGLTGLAKSWDEEWLYLSATSNDALYRLPIRQLRRDDMDTETAEGLLERVSRKAISDGLSVDRFGYVLVSDVEHGGVMRIRENGALQMLIRDERLRWASGLHTTTDGWVYVADAGLQDVLFRDAEHRSQTAPYRIWRFRPSRPALGE